jgi:hypothetical protein
MNYDQRLALAKIVYRDINPILEKWMKYTSLGIKIGKHGWDGYISVDGEEFRHHQLEDHSED